MSAREGQTPSTCGYPGCIGWDGECNETCDGGPPASPANPRPIEAREGQPPAPELARNLRAVADSVQRSGWPLGNRDPVLLRQAADALDAAVRDAATLREALAERGDLLDYAWTILANVSEGDWTKQPAEWQEAVIRWRDRYHAALAAAAPADEPLCNCPRDGDYNRVGVRIEPLDPCPVHAPADEPAGDA